MSNDTVPAEAGGMPAPIKRRNFLKGAAAALASAAATSAIATEAPDELQLMIDRCSELSLLGNEAERVCYQIFHRGDRPEQGCVTGKEFGIHFWPMAKDRHSLRSDIDRIVDKQIALLRMNVETYDNRTFDLGKKTSELESHRSRLHAIFDDRQAVYNAWDISSGNRDANARTSAIWKEFFDVQDLIFEFPCADIHQLSRKAAYIAREWGSDLPPERQVAFLNEVAAFASSRGAAA